MATCRCKSTDVESNSATKAIHHVRASLCVRGVRLLQLDAPVEAVRFDHEVRRPRVVLDVHSAAADAAHIHDRLKRAAADRAVQGNAEMAGAGGALVAGFPRHP